MTDPEDMLGELSRFSAKSEEDKQERFEQSTVALVLRQLGAPPGLVKRKQAELELEFNCEWFNEMEIIAPMIATCRVFRFNMNELFENPGKSPVIQEFFERKPPEGHDPFIMIFQAYEYGRMLATNMTCPQLTHLHIVTKTGKANIVKFKDFFSSVFGNAAEGLNV